MSHTFFATCARGVEEVLAAELAALGARNVVRRRAGVSFAGTLDLALRANLWLRTANHVLLRLADVPAPGPDALYESARALPWADHLTPKMTFAVRCTRAGPEGPRDLAHTHFAALKVKDAIADAFRAAVGTRPSVDTRSPDVSVLTHFERERATIYLDTSGESLHRRGYRPEGAPAPLKETLAAAIVLLTGWDRAQPVCDPTCGSGTLLVEAALLAANAAPGLERRFGVERWLGHDPRRLNELRADARAARRPVAALLAGSDRDSRALELARRSARAAGVEAAIAWRRGDVADVHPPAPAPGLLVCNPPYGERLGEVEKLRPLYDALGDALKQRFAGWQAFVLCGSPELAGAIGLHPSRRIVLFNGPIECRLLRFELYSGTRRMS